MNYYKARRRLLLDLEGLFSQNQGSKIPLTNILYAMIKRYGFGEGTIVKVLKMFEQRGIITINNDIISVKEVKNGRKISDSEK